MEMNDSVKMCVLYDRECTACGECDVCDLNPDKKCDNCMRCVKGDADYLAIAIDAISQPQNGKKLERNH